MHAALRQVLNPQALVQVQVLENYCTQILYASIIKVPSTIHFLLGPHLKHDRVVNNLIFFMSNLLVYYIIKLNFLSEGYIYAYTSEPDFPIGKLSTCLGPQDKRGPPKLA